MATDGPTPPPCQEKVFRDGEVVFVTHSIPSNAMERWVKKIAQYSGQEVDWHFVGGRAIVKALGNIPKVHETIEELIPEHNRLYEEAMKGYGIKSTPPNGD